MTPNSTTSSARPRRSTRRPVPGQSRSRQVPSVAAGTLDTRVPPVRVRVGSPTSLIAVVPGLLGFEPGDSIVIVGTEPGSGQVGLTLRYDVPDPRRPRMAAALAGHAVALLAAQGARTAVAVGYGPDAAVAPVAAALRRCATEAGIAVTEVLRVEDRRYWSYVCTDPRCCPPDGTPFDVSRHPAARALREAGCRVLADRPALAATLAAA
ncbi:MAG TPA: DUF4192 domain-containing protein, partial [Trebonia sp.]